MKFQISLNQLTDLVFPHRHCRVRAFHFLAMVPNKIFASECYTAAKPRTERWRRPCWRSCSRTGPGWTWRTPRCARAATAEEFSARRACATLGPTRAFRRVPRHFSHLCSPICSAMLWRGDRRKSIVGPFGMQPARRGGSPARSTCRRAGEARPAEQVHKAQVSH